MNYEEIDTMLRATNRDKAITSLANYLRDMGVTKPATEALAMVTEAERAHRL